MSTSFVKILWTGINRVWQELKKDQKEQLTCYLAGPMEDTLDNGLNWRLEYKDALSKLNIKSIVPNFEEAEIIPNVEQFERDKRENLGKYLDAMRKIISKDLAFVETVDFIVTRWESERMSGTIGEAQHAYLIGQSNYLVTSKPFHEVPGWFLACFTELFHTKQELINFLEVEYNR